MRLFIDTNFLFSLPSRYEHCTALEYRVSAPIMLSTEYIFPVKMQCTFYIMTKSGKLVFMDEAGSRPS